VYITLIRQVSVLWKHLMRKVNTILVWHTDSVSYTYIQVKSLLLIQYNIVESLIVVP